MRSRLVRLLRRWLRVSGEGGPLSGLTILQSGSLVQNGDSKRCVSCMTPAVTRGLTLLALEASSAGEDFVLIIGTSLVRNSTAILSRAAEGQPEAPGPKPPCTVQTDKSGEGKHYDKDGEKGALHL